MSKNKNYLLPFILITTLFFLWGFAHNLNPILIPHLKKACQLTDFQSAFIDSSFFIAYFLMAMPAGMVMKKYGYKSGIMLGLILFALGAMMFYPAASTLSYGLFLAALFVIASGLTFLETAANPYATILGEPQTATERLNLAQSFNGLASPLASLLGGRFILTGLVLTPDQEAAMSAEELNQYFIKEASTVQIPYIIIGLVALTVALVLWKIKLPEIKEPEKTNVAKSINILAEKNLMMGVLAQFFYVGAQVCLGSFFIRFVYFSVHINEKTATEYLAVAGIYFLVGRFLGTFIMKYIAPAKLLLVYSLISVFLLGSAVIIGGMYSVYAIISSLFFLSIMFPTIFSLSIFGLGEKTKQGSSFIIMSIVGGAIFPLIMGKVSDLAGIQIAYFVPALCLLMVVYFAWSNMALTKGKAVIMDSNH
jgi:MFS transporter, FHS family, L-fucose permease